MKQETLEDIAKWVIEFRITKNEYARVSDFEMYHTIIEKVSKWQQERSYSDMQEYATFCIECDRKEMPLLLVQDWYEHYKKE